MTKSQFLIVSRALLIQICSIESLLSCTDMQLSFSKPYADTTSATARIAIRKALKNMLYMTANSNAMNHVAPGTIISYTTSPWRIGLTIANITLGVLDAAGITWVVIRVLKNRKLKEE